MLHRLFVAINLPDSVKEELDSLKALYEHLPAKWTKKENLHVTLNFFGNVSDREVPVLKEELLKKAGCNSPFELVIYKVAYGPSVKNPRMLWALLKNNPQLTKLTGDITPGNKDFLPHITLSKINQTRFRTMDSAEIPIVERELDVKFQVSSFELMESFLRPRGAKHETVESFKLQ